MSKSNRLIFFGSGPVAAASLEGLLESGFDIEAVVTKPRAAHHKGPVPVLELVEDHGLAVYTASSKKELLEVFSDNDFESPAGIVVDYGVMIPKAVIDNFPKGIINSHFSLLPQWRGADPITFALLSGQKATGVSIMLIEPTLDTGKLLAQAHYDIEPGETIISLTANLVDLSNQTLANIIPLYLADKLVPTDQNPLEEPTYSRRLTKKHGRISWEKPAQQIEREVRAYLGWPKSYANIFGHNVVITKARVAADANDGTLVMACSPGWLEVQQIIGPSGRSMSGADFIRGYKK